ncbi:hypothetical protein DUHN55_15380 [Helicobacter pylori]
MSHRRAVLTALVLTTSGALVGTSAGAAPAAPTSTGIDVICDGIGADTVTVTGELASGGTAEITRGPLTVVGRPGFTGEDASGHQVEVAPTGQGAVCTADETTTADDISQVLPAVQAVKAPTNGEVSGRLTFTVEVDTTTTSAAKSAAAQSDAQSTAAALPFESELRSYLASRPGAVGVAVRLPGKNTSWTYTKVSSRNVTASIVKVQIMSAVMMKAQAEGRALSSWEKSKISPMIRNSDNDATTALFNHIGGRAAIDSSADRLGMSGTVADPYNHWGLTSTTAADQARLMEHYARTSSVLSATNRMYGLSLMRQINSSQDWGVTAGPPAGTVALKNGWLPRTDGWHVNSIGWVKSYAPDYTIAVLTHDNPGAMSTQVSTIEGVSRIVWKNRSKLVGSTTPPPTPKRAMRGDWDGDGKADLWGLSASGRVYVMKSSGTNVGAKKVVKSGLSDATWIGSAGDVNRDGRADVLVRRGDGRLQLMRTTSSGALGTLSTIGSGWGSYTDIAAGGDVDGNGRLDILVRKVGGYVDLYDVTDSGNLRRVRAMGRPAVYYSNIMLVSDVNGDGKDDLRGVSSGGRMRTWTSTGTSWKQTSATSTGWNTYRFVASPGDVNASSTKQDDVVAVTSSGTGRLLYAATGGGMGNGYHTLTEHLGGLPTVF